MRGEALVEAGTLLLAFIGGIRADELIQEGGLSPAFLLLERVRRLRSERSWPRIDLR